METLAQSGHVRWTPSLQGAVFTTAGLVLCLLGNNESIDGKTAFSPKEIKRRTRI